MAKPMSKNEDVSFDTYYAVTKKLFEKEDFVSPAKLQRYMQIPYIVARTILDKMIAEQFCEPQDGARPCRIRSNTTNYKN